MQQLSTKKLRKNTKTKSDFKGNGPIAQNAADLKAFHNIRPEIGKNVNCT